MNMIGFNKLKQALAERQVRIGLWCSLSSSYSTEILAGSGYDWMALDMEHSPNDLQTVLVQLQAMAGYEVEPVVRLVRFDKDLVKQYLDLGVRSLVLPNVESAEEARAIVRATRYPGQGVRGVAGQQRANRWGREPGYVEHAHEQICVLAQIESTRGVENVRAIASVEGLDGVFVGPNDLAASMGCLGRPSAPEVQQAIREVATKTLEAGKAAGILAVVEEDARRYASWGYTMVGIGSDQGLLVKASDQLVANFRRFQREASGID
jgi:2-keto-3-deoxy-L-rhamnonate aldolase RhmA